MLVNVAGVHTAARHERVSGADSSRISESDIHVIIIILFQKGIGKDAEDVALVVVPVFVYKL